MFLIGKLGSAGSLEIDGPITGTGDFQLGVPGEILSTSSAVGSGITMNFTTTTGGGGGLPPDSAVIVADASGFAGSFTGWTEGDTVDLTNVPSLGATETYDPTTGHLTLDTSVGTFDLNFGAGLTQSQFGLEPDGHGSLDIVSPPTIYVWNTNSGTWGAVEHWTPPGGPPGDLNLAEFLNGSGTITLPGTASNVYLAAETGPLAGPWTFTGGTLSLTDFTQYFTPTGSYALDVEGSLYVADALVTTFNGNTAGAPIGVGLTPGHVAYLEIDAGGTVLAGSPDPATEDGADIGVGGTGDVTVNNGTFETNGTMYVGAGGLGTLTALGTAFVAAIGAVVVGKIGGHGVVDLGSNAVLTSYGSVEFGGGGTLDLTGGIISPPLVDFDSGSSLQGYGTIESAVVNNSTFDVGTGDLSILNGAISGTGLFQLQAGSTLTAGSTVGAGQTIDFGTGAQPRELVIDSPSGFAATIDDFNAGSTIEVAGFVATGSHYASNHLTLVGGGSLTLDIPGLNTQDLLVTTSGGNTFVSLDNGPTLVPFLKDVGVTKDVALTIGMYTDPVPLATGNPIVIDAPARGTLTASHGRVYYTETLNPTLDRFSFDLTDKDGVSSPVETGIIGAGGTYAITGAASGYTVVDTGGGPSTMTLFGSNNTVRFGHGKNTVTDATATGGDNTVVGSTGATVVSLIGSGGGNTIALGSGKDTITVGGLDNMITLGRGRDVVNGGTGDTIGFTGATKLTVSGLNETVFIGPGGGKVTDHGTGTVIGVGPTASGLESIYGFSADVATGVIDLLGDVGGITTPQEAYAALTSDGHGGSKLVLSGGPTLDISGVTPAMLSAANFKIG